MCFYMHYTSIKKEQHHIIIMVINCLIFYYLKMSSKKYDIRFANLGLFFRKSQGRG